MVVHIPTGVVALGPAAATPPRRPGSVRRTSTIDATWPESTQVPVHLMGRARDLLTPADGGQPQVLAQSEVVARIGADRRAVQIEAIPPHPIVAQLTDMTSGWRRRLVEALPEEAEAGTPLFFLLDDLSGAAFVSVYAMENWGLASVRDATTPEAREQRQLHMLDICAGWQQGSSAYGTDDSGRVVHHSKQVRELPDSDDPWAWHALDRQEQASARRARRVDVWREGGAIRVDAFFQDAGTTPAGHRIAAHEYTFTAIVDETGVIRDIEAVPRVLPFDECPMAAGNARALIGVPIDRLRTVVNERLPGIKGCTHMNDALRALAEVPILARALR
jgi:hypothetical protein